MHLSRLLPQAKDTEVPRYHTMVISLNLKQERGPQTVDRRKQDQQGNILSTHNEPNVAKLIGRRK